jgi:hypothetical protein
MKMQTTSIRFRKGTLQRLQVLAHLRSLETGRNVSWNEMVRELVEHHFLGEKERGVGAHLGEAGE